MDADPFKGIDPPLQRTVRQHYVPVSYLARFTGVEGELWVYDKVTGERRPSTPKAVALENLFYQLGPAARDEAAKRADDLQLVERAMQHYESIFKQAADLLISEGRFVGIQPDVQALIARYMVIQHLRTPRARKYLAAVHNDGLAVLYKDELEKLHEKDADQYRVAVAEEDYVALHLRSLFDEELVGGIADCLHRHVWYLAIAPDAIGFATSDHPVAKRAHIIGQREAYDGFGSPGIEIVFPVCKKLAIVLKEPSFHATAKPLHLTARPVSEREVRLWNRMQAASARRWVFASNDDFDDVSEFCDKHTFLREPDREDRQTIYHKPRRHKKGTRQLVHFRSVDRKYDWEVDL